MTQELPGGAIDPPVRESAPHETYTELSAREVLGFQACRSCSGAVFPPRGRCSHCGVDALTWRSSGGRGTVYSTTVLSPRDKPSFAVVLVDLDEGYRMMSRITGADAASVSIDDRVAVTFERVGDDVLPLFSPEGGVR